MNEQNFYGRLKLNGGCWEWTGSIDTRGYGSLKWLGRQTRAHRLAYIFANGDIPQGDGHHGTVVMHTCDNRKCCNPAHLVLGTHADNMADMARKGRRKNVNVAAKNGRAKLTEEQVQAIRQDTRGKRTIAPDYGISPAQVQRIRLGKQWKTNV